jgi:hypothetical protein
MFVPPLLKPSRHYSHVAGGLCLCADEEPQHHLLVLENRSRKLCCCSK